MLHVDDDPSVLDLSAAVIEDEYDGLTVRTATSAADGLDVIAEEPVDCVVSDYDMPEMDGLAFLEAVRETHPALPFVLFTGAGSEGLASKAISAGVTDYLRKGTGPWRYEILGNRIESAVEARRAERRSAEWVRAMEGSIDGMAILGPEGQYVHVNEAHAAVYGYDDPAAFVGETWHVCYPDEEVERFEGEIMPTLREAGQWRGEAVGLRADGSTFPQELSLTEIGGGRLMCVVRDVTERKERERELDRNTDLLEQTQRMATVGGWELDLVDGELRWTDEVRRIHGVGLDYEPDVESALEFYHPEDVSTVEDALDRAIEHGERFDVSCRLVTADGDRRWVRAQGEPHREHDETIRLRGTIQDITERKARERRRKALSDVRRSRPGRDPSRRRRDRRTHRGQLGGRDALRPSGRVDRRQSPLGVPPSGIESTLS